MRPNRSALLFRLIAVIIVIVLPRDSGAETRRQGVRYATTQDVILMLVADKGAQGLMLEMLSRYPVTIANTALEAGVLMRSFDYRLVIVSNLGMPPDHAVSVVPQEHQYPVIFISGFWNDELRRVCRDKRLRCINAPFDFDTLQKAVNEEIANATSRR